MAQLRHGRRIAAVGAIALGLGIAVPSVASALDAPKSVAPAAQRVAAGPAIVNVTMSNLQQTKDLAKTQPVVFLVTAPSWCGACQHLDPIIKKIANADGGKWTLAIIDQDRAGGAHREFRASALPTMIPWGKNGEMTSPKRKVGSGSESEIRSWINSVVQSYGPVTPGPAPQPNPPAPTPPVPNPPVPNPPAPSPGPAPAPAPAPGQAIMQVTSANLAEAKAVAQQRPVVFLVTAPSWCGACQQLEPIIKKVANAGGGKWTLAVIDTDRSGGAEKEFRVSGLPTMIGYGKNGEMRSPARKVGADSEARVQAWVDSVIKAWGPLNPGPQPGPTPPAPPVPTPPVPTPPVPTPPGPTPPAPTPPAPNPPAPDDGKLPELPPGAVQLTDQNFDSAVIQESSKRTVVIDFSKDQCGPCLQIAPVLDEKYKADKGKWQYTRLDGTAYPELWKKYDNPWFPTLIAIRDGKEIARRSGYEGDVAAVKTWLDAVADNKPPASDPMVMDLKGEADWNTMAAISKRHPVAIRMHVDNLAPDLSKAGTAIAEKMANGDGSKWTLAKLDVSTPYARKLVTGGQLPLKAVPSMVVFYNGKVRLEPLNGKAANDETKMRAWVDTMLSTHYPEN